MPKDWVRYAALLACVVMLACFGIALISEEWMALPLFLTLAAAGTLLARHPAGPRLCLAAGVAGPVFSGIQLVFRPQDPTFGVTAVAFVAGLAALAAAVVLMRQASPQSADPAP